VKARLTIHASVSEFHSSAAGLLAEWSRINLRCRVGSSRWLSFMLQPRTESGKLFLKHPAVDGTSMEPQRAGNGTGHLLRRLLQAITHTG
jgi:hypothetical protein